jgi:hypothetical protein
MKRALPVALIRLLVVERRHPLYALAVRAARRDHLHE